MTRVAAIVGPTAAGKSDIAMRIAEKLDAEIVSVDSMQIYRRMDAGTAKPGLAQRASVRHHLIDVLDPSVRLTVADYQRWGREAIGEIEAAGRLPLLVGGSGLYFRAVVDDLVFPPRSPQVRSRLEQEADRYGAEVLHSRLAEIDPDAAAKIEPSNIRRTVRALEVIEVTGCKFSANARAWRTYESIYDLSVAGLTWDRAPLFRRIAERVDAMIEAGLIEEARRLGEEGLSVTARQALGYRQVLQSPVASPVETVKTEIVKATKRFARRQLSWFRADPRVTWFDAGSALVTERITDHFRRSLRLTPRRVPI
jgi:tRNA dimethylallyltransferase